MSEEANVIEKRDPTVESPPATELPAREAAPDPRVDLLRLAAQLRRQPNRRQLVEYLRLRRRVG